MSGRTLDPLAARYADWLNLPAADTGDTSDEDAASVRAMPLVLRIERANPPGRTELLEAAAMASIALCLDARAAPGGEWHAAVRAWVDGRIRKVSRRARGSHWHAVQELPGYTASRGAAEVRALVPTQVADYPKEVSRLQISGTELEQDDPGPPRQHEPLLLLNPGVEMTVGKATAQVGHATMILAALLTPDEITAWAGLGYRCSVRTATPRRWAQLQPGSDPETAWREHRIVAVRDAGFTEVDPGTVTVLARWT